jgi:hypothetical protein
MVTLTVHRFDKRLDDVPHPDINSRNYVDFVVTNTRTMPHVWDPVSKVMQPWLNVKEIKNMYRLSSGCVIL